MDEYREQLKDLVRDSVKDILFDNDLLKKTKTHNLVVLEDGTDDGIVSGVYHIIINGGELIVELSANAAYAGEQDCWSWSSESHYTKTVTFDELQEYEYKVLGIRGGPKEDRSIDADIESAKENKK